MPLPHTSLQVPRKVSRPTRIAVVEAGAAAAVLGEEQGQGQGAVPRPVPHLQGRDRTTLSTHSHGGISST
jgi:hypothetical protein